MTPNDCVDLVPAHPIVNAVSRLCACALILLLAACATPYGGNGLLGGASEKRVADDRFLIRSGINAFSPPGLLKPLMLKRAREVGASTGYKSFVIEAVEVHYDAPGMQYNAQTSVKFSREALPPRAGSVYAVDAPDSYRPSLDGAESSSLARLKGSSHRDRGAALLMLVPVYFDAVSATSYGHGSTSYVVPGNQKFFVHFWVTPTAFGTPRSGFITMERRLEASRSYAVVGVYKDRTIELWLEDEQTGTPAGPKESISLGAR
jgi:hypothetical protein